MSKENYIIRRAERRDIGRMRAMQERSMRTLGSAFYSQDEIEAFLTHSGTMDDAVVDEGHFFVAENADGKIVGTGGWSRLRPGYAAAGGSDSECNATVRSMFTDPDFARRGIATAIMARTEADAVFAAVGVVRLTATLSGLSLYENYGFRACREIELRYPGDVRFGGVEMVKRIGAARFHAA